MHPSRLLAAAVVLAVLLSACNSSGAAVQSVPVLGPTPTQVATPTIAPTVPPTAAPTPTPEPVSTPEPTVASDEPTLFAAGDVVTVTQNDEPYLDIVVSRVSQKTKYGSGYFVDKPGKGNVYIQALITYTALADGATYNPFDWQVFCNDEAVDSYTYVSDGPEPDLNSGTLPKGRKAKGWVVYEIPAKGRCVLSYGANSFIDEGAVFEVLIRKG